MQSKSGVVIPGKKEPAMERGQSLRQKRPKVRWAITGVNNFFESMKTAQPVAMEMSADVR